jgi:hypothetical protein
MSTDLLQAFQILTKLRVDTVGENLRVFAIDDITLTIEEPGWNLVLSGVLDDGNDTLELFGGKFSSTVIYCQVCFLNPQEENPTACSSRHQPSCRPSWSNVFRHPLSWSMRT